MTAADDQFVQTATGALAAQEAIDQVKRGEADPGVLWLRFLELTVKHGRSSPACRSFLLELGKRAAR